MRGKSKYKKIDIKPDIGYRSLRISKLINYAMSDGKKAIAAGQVYRALKIAEDKLKKLAVEILETAIVNGSPQMEVITRRIGGANYQIPVEVRLKRQVSLAMKWMIEAARQNRQKEFYQTLANILIDTYKNSGPVVEKKEKMHKAAQANKAFAHFAKY